MTPDKPTIHTFLNRKGAAFAGIIVSVFLIAAVGSGCGDSSSSGSSTKPPAPASGISRPSAGVVEVIDSLGDTIDPGGKGAGAPREVDINRVTVSREGQNLIFTMDVSGNLPEVRPPDTLAAEWGFLLDTDGDGTADWGIFARFPKADNWSWGLFNQKTKEQAVDQQFPGTMTRNGTTLTLTINAVAIGSPQSFKWVAYTDDVARLVAGETAADTKQAGDRVPQDAWPLGNSWLDYP